MITRMLSHVRNNTVAYLALVFSVIGGGGGYAVAATTHHANAKKTKKTAIVACASKKTGELFLHRHGGKCAKGRHKLSWSVKGPKGARGAAGKAGAAGAAGAPAPSIFGVVGAVPGQFFGQSGLTAQHLATGVTQITVTDATCSQGTNAPVITPTASTNPGEPAVPANAAPIAWIDDSLSQGNDITFVVHTGITSASGFTPEDLRFDVQDTCVPSGIQP